MESRSSRARDTSQSDLTDRAGGREQQSFYRGPSNNESNRSFDRSGNERNTNRTVDQLFNERQDADPNLRDRDRDESRVASRERERSRLDGDRERDGNRFDGTREENRFDTDRDGNRSDRDGKRFDGDRDGGTWSRNADRFRNDWNRRDRNNLPFLVGWWNNYSLNRWPIYSPWRYSWWRNQPYYWWGWTPAARLTNWFGFGWNQPRYWSYGPGANIYYQGDYVYYDGDEFLPVDDYYQRIYDLAHSVPEIDESEAENMDWAPLGVFVVGRSSEDEAGQRTLQLAVNRQGVLSGSYYNAENGHVHPISGMVDERTQRAAWAFADGEHPKTVFETSIFNLTQRESTMMVHFGPDSADTEVWHLARIERPEASSQGSSRRNDLP